MIGYIWKDAVFIFIFLCWFISKTKSRFHASVDVRSANSSVFIYLLHTILHIYKGREVGKFANYNTLWRPVRVWQYQLRRSQTVTL